MISSVRQEGVRCVRMQRLRRAGLGYRAAHAVRAASLLDFRYQARGAMARHGASNARLALGSRWAGAGLAPAGTPMPPMARRTAGSAGRGMCAAPPRPASREQPAARPPWLARLALCALCAPSAPPRLVRGGAAPCSQPPPAARITGRVHYPDACPAGLEPRRPRHGVHGAKPAQPRPDRRHALIKPMPRPAVQRALLSPPRKFLPRRGREAICRRRDSNLEPRIAAYGRVSPRCCRPGSGDQCCPPTTAAGARSRSKT